MKLVVLLTLVLRGVSKIIKKFLLKIWKYVRASEWVANLQLSTDTLKCQLSDPNSSFLVQQQQQSSAFLPVISNPAAEGGQTTKVVQLTEAVTLEELANDEEYNDIVEDMRDECSKVRPPFSK